MNISEIQHPIPPVWNEQSRALILGTMPSPKSRQSGFFYMHPQNRFWSVMSEVFGEEFEFPNKVLGAGTTETTITAAISERRAFLLRHKLAMWDVLAACKIEGAADSTIRNAVPNDFTQIFESTRIHDVFLQEKQRMNFGKNIAPVNMSSDIISLHIVYQARVLRMHNGN